MSAPVIVFLAAAIDTAVLGDLLHC